MKVFLYIGNTDALEEPNKYTSWKNDLLYLINTRTNNKVFSTKRVIQKDGRIFAKVKESYQIELDPNTTYLLFDTYSSKYPERLLLRKGYTAFNYPIVRELIRDKAYVMTLLKSKGIPILPFRVNCLLDTYPFVCSEFESVYYASGTSWDIVNNIEDYKEKQTTSDYPLISREYIKKDIQVDYSVLTCLYQPISVNMRVSLLSKFNPNLYKDSVWIPISHMEDLTDIKKPVFSSMHNNTIDSWNNLVIGEERRVIEAAKQEFSNSFIPIKEINKIADLAHKTSKKLALGLGAIDIIKDNKKLYVTNVSSGIDEVYHELFGSEAGEFLFAQLVYRRFL